MVLNVKAATITCYPSQTQGMEEQGNILAQIAMQLQSKITKSFFHFPCCFSLGHTWVICLSKSATTCKTSSRACISNVLVSLILDFLSTLSNRASFLSSSLIISNSCKSSQNSISTFLQVYL